MIIRLSAQHYAVDDTITAHVSTGEDPTQLEPVGVLRFEDPEHWKTWSTWMRLAAAMFAMTRTDAAAGIKLELYINGDGE